MAYLLEVGDEMGDGRGGALVEAMQRHDSLLPDGLLGVAEQLDDLRQHRGDGLLVDELADGDEGGGDDEVVVGSEVLLDGVDDEDDEVVVVAEEEGDGEVAGALDGEGLVVGHLDGVDVAEGGVVAEHLDVDEADEVLLHAPAGDVGVGEAAAEGVDLAEHDPVLLGLGPRLADRLHQVQELLRLAPAALGAHGELPPDRLQLLQLRDLRFTNPRAWIGERGMVVRKP